MQIPSRMLRCHQDCGGKTSMPHMYSFLRNKHQHPTMIADSSLIVLMLDDSHDGASRYPRYNQLRLTTLQLVELKKLWSTGLVNQEVSCGQHTAPAVTLPFISWALNQVMTWHILLQALLLQCSRSKRLLPWPLMPQPPTAVAQASSWGICPSMA